MDEVSACARRAIRQATVILMHHDLASDIEEEEDIGEGGGGVTCVDEGESRRDGCAIKMQIDASRRGNQKRDGPGIPVEAGASAF